ncbi:thiamine/thiamine pyrophosphate ABC transporter permease [Oceanisphaera arctica]|uniref:Thiamine transport system permease protein ThiP n=1 Tax=Oceanisphaera arctica TaxID=641510 RepID=A0A2P5TNE9_9GAMM|nr:thiamine/thiamine pyrophosphate ABC transporter permease [Oceanisphaera arctica]PPL17048.1 thiamine/thiamine pyrophosphate ABC transporter, permease protein [Oceanisphaera arctica]GHA07161.1 thiamine/thiamine pyrophosphate ABC transporter, permease protein [Oceanisphaera arctica]
MHRKYWWIPGSLSLLGILLLTAGPITALLVQGSQSSLSRLLHDSYLHRVVWFSFYQALLSTLLSLLLAIPLAQALSRRHFPGRRLLLRLFGLSLVLPVILVVFGIVTVHGRQGWVNQLLQTLGFESVGYLYGLTGILLAHVFFNMPLAARILLQGIEGIPSSQWRMASQLGFTGWQLFRWLEWPVIRSALPALGSMIFMLCFTSFATVMALGGGPKSTTLEVAIYQALRFDFDLPLAGMLALLQLLFCSGFLLLQYGLTKAAPEQHASSKLAIRPDRQRIGVRLWDVLILTLGLGLFLPPLLAIISSGLNPSLWAALSSSLLWHATLTSVIIASCAALLSVLLTLGLLSSSRYLRLQLQRKRGAALMEATGSVILVLPAVVLSTGLFILLRDIADIFTLGPILVLLVNALMALPYGLRALQLPMERVSLQYGRLCTSLDVQGLARLRLVEWPLLRKPVALALALAMMLSLGDLSAIALFGSQSLQTLPWLLYQQLGNYQMIDAAATALVLLLLSLGLFGLIEGVLGGKDAATE